MMVGFVDQHRDIAWNAVEQLLDFLFGNDVASRVVWVADVNKPDVDSSSSSRESFRVCPSVSFSSGTLIASP
jgi:hypothetical protein